MKIIMMGISSRSKACLRKAGYEEIEEILGLSKDELMEIKNLNESCADEILSAIEEYSENPAVELIQENTVGENDTSYASGVIDTGIEEQVIKDGKVETGDSEDEWDLSTLLKLSQMNDEDFEMEEDKEDEEKKSDAVFLSLSRIIEESDFCFPIDVVEKGWKNGKHMRIETIRNGYAYGTVLDMDNEIDTERLSLKSDKHYSIFRR